VPLFRHQTMLHAEYIKRLVLFRTNTFLGSPACRPFYFGYCVFGNQLPFIRNYLRFFGRDFSIWVRDCRLNSFSTIICCEFGRMPPSNVSADSSAGGVRAFGTYNYSFPNFSAIRRRRLHSRRQMVQPSHSNHALLG